MNAKFTLAIIALVGIGVFALPSTMSLFAGQHSFYNIDATGNQVPCKKCHGDVQAELGSNAAGPAGSDAALRSPGPHAAMSCEYCHRIEAGVSSGDDAFWQVNYASGNDRRTLLISQFDYEFGNIPATIANNATKAQIQTASNITWLNAVISDSTNMNNTSTLTAGSESLVQTYYSNGTAKDPNPATKNSGVRLGSMTAVNFTYNGTAQPAINWNRFGSRIVNPGSTYHAASLVSCLECHGRGEPLGHETNRTTGLNGMVNCADCHYGGSANLASEGKAGQAMRNLWAGGFGVTTGRNDTGEAEAHRSWVTTQGASRFGKGNGKVEANNDACIACHTHVAVDINFVKGYKLSISAISGTNSNGSSGYTVSNAAVEGHVYVSTFGNQSGETFAVGQATYSWTPTGQPLYINGNKTNVLNGLNGDTSDSASALQ